MTGPSHGSLGAVSAATCTPSGSGSNCTATVTYTPTTGYSGPDSFTFKANDGTLNSNTATESITVTAAGYTFAGFFQPIDNPPVVNKANAGQAIPVKWNLMLNGQPVSDPNSFVSITSTRLLWDGPADSSRPTRASGLRYQGNGNWQFNWKTPKVTPAVSDMTLTLSDGSQHMADFQFK